MTVKRAAPQRVADLLPELAQSLGLEDELQRSRAMASWARIVEEHVAGAAGASALLAVAAPALVVSATSPIVAQELRYQATELLAAFARAPGGSRLLELRIAIRARAT